MKKNKIRMEFWVEMVDRDCVFDLETQTYIPA